MHTRNGHLRGLADVRTQSGLNAHAVAPHTAYMKITSLELEKLRLGRVRQNAVTRIAGIDARYKDINAEKAKLLGAMAAAPAAAPQPSHPARRARGFTTHRSSGLSLRY